VLLAGLERAGSGAGSFELIRGGATAPLPGRRASQPARRTAAQEELTAHEVRIASMMLDGMTNKQIADAFTVSTRAVELHITRIYRKLDIRRRAQLAAAMGRAPVATA
jgi:DNA-binding NarL/FixJ family response regulator